MKRVASASRDKDGFWVSSLLFPSSVHKCETMDDAEKLAKALNEAYACGANDTRASIRNGLFELIGFEPQETDE